MSGYEGYIPGEPEWWSGNRLRADATDEPGQACLVGAFLLVPFGRDGKDLSSVIFAD